MASKESDPPPGAPDWIVTFADMISLLVTFFILLMTFSSLEELDAFQVPERIIGSTGTLSNWGGENCVPPPKMDVMSAMDVKRGADIPHSRPASELLDEVHEMGQEDTEDHVEIDLQALKDGIVIRYDERGAFQPGSTELSPYLKSAVGELARVLEHYPYTIVIEGHTDDRVKPTSLHPDAEALSIARASAVADEALTASNLSALQVQVSGYGGARPRVSNETPEGRRMNRRVEIRVMSLSQARIDALSRSRSSDG